jgi:DGQHR domain-containing protein
LRKPFFDKKEIIMKACYFGCHLVQRIDRKTTPFFIFVARAKDIKEWAGIRRTEEIEKGTQRILKKTRSHAVSKFLNVSSINTIPNNVLIAFQAGKTKFIPVDLKSTQQDTKESEQSEIDFYNQCKEQISWGILEFSYETNQPDYLRPALIVDGQHRLYGMYEFNEEDLPVLVVSLIDASPQEQAFQFIVINKKAVRVSTDNVKSIVVDFNEQELEDRLAKVGVTYGNTPSTLQYLNDSPSSPFQNLLNWPYNRDVKEDSKLVPITAIEQALRYIKKEFTVFEEDDDSIIEFFCAVWNMVKKNYSEIWGKNDKFMRKVNINALNEYIIYRLKVFWSSDFLDIFDVKQVEAQVLGILKKIKQEFWLAEWFIKIQDNANVKEMIKNDLQTMIDNDKLGRDWFDNLELPKME